MTELERLLKEVEEVYLEEKAEGNIEEWEQKQNFIQESVNLYIEKIKMNRYDKDLILEELMNKYNLANYRVYVDDRMISLQEMLQQFMADKLEIAIRRVCK